MIFLQGAYNFIRRGFDYVTSAYPEAHFIWMDILQRLRWTESYQADIIIESKGRRVNRFGRALVNQLRVTAWSMTLTYRHQDFSRMMGHIWVNWFSHVFGCHTGCTHEHSIECFEFWGIHFQFQMTNLKRHSWKFIVAENSDRRESIFCISLD